MEEVVVWAVGGLLMCFAVVSLIGFIAILFAKPDAEDVERRKPRRRWAGAFLAGLALGMWWRDESGWHDD